MIQIISRLTFSTLTCNIASVTVQGTTAGNTGFSRRTPGKSSQTTSFSRYTCGIQWICIFAAQTLTCNIALLTVQSAITGNTGFSSRTPAKITKQHPFPVWPVGFNEYVSLQSAHCPATLHLLQLSVTLQVTHAFRVLLKLLLTRQHPLPGVTAGFRK